jgi:DNA polymerase III sliding clamp (beta) subunit (PCNA family)
MAKFKKVYDNIPMAEINSEINAINELGKENTFEIAYNPKYMAEALKTYNENIELRMTRNINPIIVTEDIDKGLELVLPVRIRG